MTITEKLAMENNSLPPSPPPQEGGACSAQNPHDTDLHGTHSPLLRREAGGEAVHLWKEGVFWVAYERSAYWVHLRSATRGCNPLSKNKEGYKPTKKYIKSVGGDVVTVGFPHNALPFIVGAEYFPPSEHSNSPQGDPHDPYGNPHDQQGNPHDQQDNPHDQQGGKYSAPTVMSTENHITFPLPAPIDHAEFLAWKHSLPPAPSTRGGEGQPLPNPPLKGGGVSFVQNTNLTDLHGTHSPLMRRGAGGEAVWGGAFETGRTHRCAPTPNIVEKIEQFDLSNATPMQCMNFLHSLKQDLQGSKINMIETPP